MALHSQTKPQERGDLRFYFRIVVVPGVRKCRGRSLRIPRSYQDDQQQNRGTECQDVGNKL